MKIVIPHTGHGLAGETVLALARHSRHGDHLQFTSVGRDDEAYWRLLRDLWEQREDVVIVEQDIVIHDTVLDGFDDCPGLWCTHGYPYDIYSGYTDYHGAGCVRWRAELMAQHPDAIEKIGAQFGPNHPPRHWCSLDGFFQLEMQARAVEPCRHQPPVRHMNPTPSHDCAQAF